MSVLVRNILRNREGKSYLGKWQKLESENVKVLKWYCRHLVKESLIGEFIGFGWYGCISVDGWIWVESERVRKD